MYSASDFYRQPEELERKPVLPYNPCDGMSPEEMSRYIQFLFEQILQKDAQHKELLEQFAEIKGELKHANEVISSYALAQQRLNALVASLTEQLHEAQQTITDLLQKKEELQSSLRASKTRRLGSPGEK